MGRLYETDADLRREREAVAVLCEALDCEAVKLPLNSRADMLLHRDGEAKTVVEFKHRSNRRRKYETYMISLSKYEALVRWHQMGFKAVLLVRWTDELAYVLLPAEHFVLDGGGRRDRGDPYDTERVAHIPTHLFQTIKKFAE